MPSGEQMSIVFRLSRELEKEHKSKDGNTIFDKLRLLENHGWILRYHRSTKADYKLPTPMFSLERL
jgi:hypothetical protein